VFGRLPYIPPYRRRAILFPKTFWFASVPQKSVPAELVDALDLVLGKQTYTRALHAKGIVLEGRFLPSSVATT
jgi:hypothetical protein